MADFIEHFTIKARYQEDKLRKRKVGVVLPKTCAYPAFLIIFFYMCDINYRFKDMRLVDVKTKKKIEKMKEKSIRLFSFLFFNFGYILYMYL